MYEGSTTCIICGREIKYNLKTKHREYTNDDFNILSKNQDGSFKCRIIAKCLTCTAKSEFIDNLKLDLDN